MTLVVGGGLGGRAVGDGFAIWVCGLLNNGARGSQFSLGILMHNQSFNMHDGATIGSPAGTHAWSDAEYYEDALFWYFDIRK